MKAPITLVEETKPKKPQRADLVPEDGFTLVVDGCFKSHYDDEASAKKVGLDLLSRYPMLQVLIYDAATKTRAPIA
jgi:hypothetical protein